MSAAMTLGPVQMLVVVFDGNDFHGEILPELRRLRENDIVRLIDLLVVGRDVSGDVNVVQWSDLTPEEARQFGSIVCALMGLGAAGDEDAAAGAAAMERGVRVGDQDVLDVAERIPLGSSAAILLVEHLWVIPLRDAIARAGGAAVVDEWVHPGDVVGLGP
jgi:uncharacterized membrane protein